MVEDAEASRTTGSSPSPSVLTSSPWSRSLDWSSMGGSISTSSSSRCSCCSLPFPTIWEPQSWDTQKKKKRLFKQQKTPLRHRVIHTAFYLPSKAAVNKLNPVTITNTKCSVQMLTSMDYILSALTNLKAQSRNFLALEKVRRLLSN